MSQTDGGRPDDQSDEGPLSVSDEELPDDLRPGEDNPLAQPAGDEVPDDILMETSEKRPLEEGDDAEEGEHAEESGED